MKEIVHITYNYLAYAPTEPGKPIEPSVEVAITISEPHYRIGNDGEMFRARETETIRFLSSPKVLRKVAEGLIQAAGEGETALSERLREHAEKTA